MSLSKRRQEGWLMIDNRASGGSMFESATVTCAHCQTQVVLNPDRSRPRGYCFKCDHYICDNPACNFECIPIEKVFDTCQEQAALGRPSTVPFLFPQLAKRGFFNG